MNENAADKGSQPAADSRPILAPDVGPSEKSISSAAAATDLAAARRVVWLSRCLAAFTLALFGVTWRLWTPQSVYPRVPLVYAAVWLPESLDWLFMLLAAGGLVVAGCRARPDPVWQRGLSLFASGLAVLIVMDQHRWQPWAYQALLVAVALANASPPRAWALVRLLTISIYLYSGLSKLDYDFLHTLGPQFLDTLLGPLGADPQHWPAAPRLAGAAAFPLVELAIAAGFCCGRTRRAALAGSLLLHGTLLFLLGPWGLRHSPGVLVWNGYFMVQNVLLFAVDPVQNWLAASAPRQRVAVAVVGAALLLPILEPLGLFDAWPSWAVYAPGSERVVVFVHRRALDRLGLLRQFAGTDGDDSWVRLRTDRWSLEALGVPANPQSRFQLGVAEAVGRAGHLDRWIRVVEFGRASRWTGHREQRSFSGLGEIRAATAHFWLNGRPDPRFLLIGPAAQREMGNSGML